jgi:YfiH family protein
MNIFNRSDLKTKKGLPYFENPEITRLGWIQHGFFTRKGGMSLPPYDLLNLSNANGDQVEHVSQNMNLISSRFGFDLKRLILPHQIHQDRILLIKESFSHFPSFLEYDALITNTPNTFLGILTADCVPILVVDQRKKVIAAIHAGRQGTALHITAKVLKKMEEEFGCSPGELLIALGPSIGFCCYEIDEKVFLPEWEPFSILVGNGKMMVDLARINIAQMEKEGVKEEQISWIDLCTSCHHDLFFSQRKERGKTGRQLSFIGLTGQE